MGGDHPSDRFFRGSLFSWESFLNAGGGDCPQNIQNFLKFFLLKHLGMVWAALHPFSQDLLTIWSIAFSHRFNPIQIPKQPGCFPLRLPDSPAYPPPALKRPRLISGAVRFSWPLPRASNAPAATTSSPPPPLGPMPMRRPAASFNPVSPKPEGCLA